MVRPRLTRPRRSRCRTSSRRSSDVRFWHKADITDVRFLCRYWVSSGLSRTELRCRLFTHFGHRRASHVAAAKAPAIGAFEWDKMRTPGFPPLQASCTERSLKLFFRTVTRLKDERRRQMQWCKIRFVVRALFFIIAIAIGVIGIPAVNA